MYISGLITTQVIYIFSCSPLEPFSSLNIQINQWLTFILSEAFYILHNTIVQTSLLSTKVPALGSCSRPSVYSPPATSLISRKKEKRKKLLFLFPIIQKLTSPGSPFSSLSLGGFAFLPSLYILPSTLVCPVVLRKSLFFNPDLMATAWLPTSNQK